VRAIPAQSDNDYDNNDDDDDDDDYYYYYYYYRQQLSMATTRLISTQLQYY